MALDILQKLTPFRWMLIGVALIIIGIFTAIFLGGVDLILSGIGIVIVAFSLYLKFSKRGSK